MRKLILIASLLFIYQSALTQDYGFETIVNLEATEVKSQGNTGTCWSFSTVSFLESELIRMGKGKHNISEMYNVRHVYMDKADNYVRRQGKAQFSQGSLAHDVINTISKHGLVPDEAYSGLEKGVERHDHDELEGMLKAIVFAAMDMGTISTTWKSAYSAILDVYLGEEISKFKYQNKEYTPMSFATEMGIKSENYVSISSFSHHPFYSEFILEVPDNWSNGSFENVTIDELEKVTQDALKAGFSLCWDADVSEKTFSSKHGIAVIPSKNWKEMSEEEQKAAFQKPIKEASINDAYRQKHFDNQNTTDDHLMHITGLIKDKEGNIWYKVKNSWGKKRGIDGYIYVSSAYFRAKTISILLHKDAVSKDVAKKIF